MGFIYWSQFLYIRAHNILWNDDKNELIDSVLLTFRNLTLAKFIKWYFTWILLMLKKRKDQTESVQKSRNLNNNLLWGSEL